MDLASLSGFYRTRLRVGNQSVSAAGRSSLIRPRAVINQERTLRARCREDVGRFGADGYLGESIKGLCFRFVCLHIRKSC